MPWSLFPSRLHCALLQVRLHWHVSLTGQAKTYFCLRSGYLQCPICNVVYGVRIGTMPQGTMRVSTSGSVRAMKKACALGLTLPLRFNIGNGYGNIYSSTHPPTHPPRI